MGPCQARRSLAAARRAGQAGRSLIRLTLLTNTIVVILIFLGLDMYTDKFESILKTTGVESVKLPPRSPNLNAHAERFIRSIKEQCLDHLILSSEDQLHYVLAVP